MLKAVHTLLVDLLLHLDLHHGEAEVDELDVASVVDEDVLGLEVSVDDVHLVEVLNGENGLCYDETGLVFF